MMINSTFENRPVTLNEKNNLLKIAEHMYIVIIIFAKKASDYSQ